MTCEFASCLQFTSQIDNEIEKHMELFTQLRENPTDINAIVARRRKDFNGGFFQHLNFLANAYNGLDERDGNYMPFNSCSFPNCAYLTNNSKNSL